MSEPCLCPFCNGVLPALPTPPIAAKLPCPRCGEPVAATRWLIDPALATALTSAQPPLRTPNREPGVGVRKTMYIVLGTMLVMALVGLSYMLWTTKLRRSRDPWMPTTLTPIAFRRPIELPGLAYLPKGSQLVAAIQVAELFDDKQVGQKLIAEPRPALFDWALKQIPKTTGLKLEQLDHVVVATSFDPLPPQLTMVVQTRQPYSLKTISEAVQPAKATLHGEHPLYEFALKPAGDAMLWCVEERTLIYLIRFDPPKLEHLRSLSATPRPVDEVLSAPLREAIDRLPKHNFVWAVGRLDQLGAMKEFLPLALGAKGNIGAIKDLKTFALGIAPIEGLTLTGHFQMNDAKGTAKFKTLLDDAKLAGGTSHKVEAPPADVIDPAAQWVTWQVRGDVAAMRNFLSQGKDAKK